MILCLAIFFYKMSSPWDMVAAFGIYTEEQIEDMTWAECVEILEAEY